MKIMDYWITAGDEPAEIVEQYAKVTGTVPMMPDYAMGFWQSKLRYRTQKELLNVASPEARSFVWDKVKKNYFDRRIKMFWLDEAEPEFHAYEFDNYHYQLGNCLEIGNIYPVLYAKTFLMD